MRKTLAIVGLTLLLAAPVSIAAAIKTWSNSEVLLPSDLNANFAHIHNTMVGSHGARLVNADVSASAAISQTKIANPGLLPKAWMSNGTAACTGVGNCNIAQQYPAGFFSSMTHLDAGYYSVNFASARANNAYFPMLDSTGTGAGGVNCKVQPTNTASTFYVFCMAELTPYDPTDATFSILFFDNDN